MTAVVDLEPSPLAHISPEELDAQVAADLNRLRIVSDGVDQLGVKARATYTRIDEARAKEHRDYYRPAEEDEIRGQFLTYLAYRAALLRLVATYGGFQSVTRPEARARCFLVGYGAGANVMRASTALVTTYGNEPTIRRKLNEADGSCGLRAGEFDRIYDAVANDRNAKLFEEMAAYFTVHRDQWRRQQVFDDERFAWVDGQIQNAVEAVHARNFDRSKARWERLLERVGSDVYVPVYDVQSVVSTWIGDTRIVGRPPFISHGQISRSSRSSSPAISCSSGGTGMRRMHFSPASGRTRRCTSARGRPPPAETARQSARPAAPRRLSQAGRRWRAAHRDGIRQRGRDPQLVDRIDGC
jgi:hypothetical protein